MAHLARTCAIILSSLALAQSQVLTVSVKKCCPAGQALENGTNSCTSYSGPKSFAAIRGLNLSESIHSPDRIVAIEVSTGEVGKPPCSSNMEMHQFRNGKDMTRYGEYCEDTCGQKEGTDYFWCKTKDSWDYCSIDHKYTINNQRCRYNCAKDGTDYYWCHLELNKDQKESCDNGMDSWDYCSPAKLSETWLALTDDHVNLVTSRYEAEFDHKEFCVDHMNSAEGEVVALMCNPCTGKMKGTKHCLNLCCPHGHLQTFDGCIEHNETISWNPEFWSGSDIRHEQVERNKDYILAAPGLAVDGFQCPNSRALLAAETDLGATFQLQLNGNLKATYPPNSNGCEKNESCPVVFSEDEFCMYYGPDPFDYGDYGDDPNYDSGTAESNATAHENPNAIEYGTSNGDVAAYEDGEATGDVANYDDYQAPPLGPLDFYYMYCVKTEVETTSDEVTRAMYPWAIGISSFFLALTLIALIMEPDLRKGLFGRITVGFVTNLFIGYVFISFVSNNDPPLETRACVAAGYLTQYSFLAFFFWINAMALNIFLKFSLANKFQQNTRNEEKKFWWYFLYAQGLPFVICCITALVDHFGKKAACKSGFDETTGLTGYNLKENDTLTLPNMGTFQCFLGAGHYASESSYLANPAFIYFQLFLIVIQILNITFFSITVHHLNKHWKETKGLNKNTNDSAYENLFVVIKLFVIMGVTWIFEFIGSWMEFNHSKGQWYQNHGFVIRLILDIPNLFQGFLIFFVLVCKKKVVQSLKAKVTGSSPKKDTNYSTVKTRNTNYSESGAPSEGIPLKDVSQK